MSTADFFPGLFAQFSRTAHFSEATIAAVEKLVLTKNNKPYLKCPVRQKEVLAKPEEIVRTLAAHASPPLQISALPDSGRIPDHLWARQLQAGGHRDLRC